MNFDTEHNKVSSVKKGGKLQTMCYLQKEMKMCDGVLKNISLRATLCVEPVLGQVIVESTKKKP